MALNPLNKLRRFTSAPVAPSTQKQEPAQAITAPQKTISVQAKPAPALPKDEIERLINPQSRNCAHCGTHHTKVKFIWYSEGPGYKGWYCFDCWGHHYKHKVFPPIATARAVPKRVSSVSTAN